MKTRSLIAAFSTAVLLSSCGTCVTTPLFVTNNPTGNKVGYAEYSRKAFSLKKYDNMSLGLNAAVKNGGITKISYVDQTVKSKCILGIPYKKTYRIAAYGE